MAYFMRRGFVMGALALGSLAMASPLSLADVAGMPPDNLHLFEPPADVYLERAQDLEPARIAFTRGDYAPALTTLDDFERRMSDGEAIGKVQRNSKVRGEALALRAEIMSAQIMLGLTENNYKYALKAREMAEQAVALAPNCPEAHIQYALATGFQARSAGTVTAWRKKLPQQSRAAIDGARELAPQDPRVQALIGAWHLEIINRAGEKRAASMFEASLETGIDNYTAALAQAPHDILITGNYGFALLAIDQEEYTPTVKTLFSNLQNITPQSAVERAIFDRMMAVLAAIDQPDELSALVKEFTAG